MRPPVIHRNGSKKAEEPDLRLIDVDLDQIVELVRIDLPEEQMLPLLELGVLPGCHLCPIRHSPAGDPIVMVDGSMLALRRSMADCLCVRLAPESSTH